MKKHPNDPSVHAQLIHSETSSLKIQSCCLVLLLVLTSLIMPWHAKASGTWSTVNPPPIGIVHALLLSDGTVIGGDSGSSWVRLTPDSHGSYVNGTWTSIASMNYTRLFYSSDVLTNGNIYVAGGEYGNGGGQAELYDSLNNVWTVIAPPSQSHNYIDAISKILPNGNVLQGMPNQSTFIYNVASNTITLGPTPVGGQDEAEWVRLPNDNVLTIDPFGQDTEHYVPSLNQWYADGLTPVNLYGYGGELGAGFVLPNGKAFYIGANPVTAIYTPGNSLTAAGTWAAGPNLPSNGHPSKPLGAVDAPAAMMINGNILCALGPTNGYNGPTYFYEYDYLANSFTEVNGPTGKTLSNAPYTTTMLQLPDGSILFVSGQGTTALYTYMPSGTPLAAGKPAISSIAMNANGSYHLVGTGLNGISAGAAYGDDFQMDTDYPIVRMTNNSTGNVYFGRTYNWSSTTIMNTNPVTTEFSLPPTLPAGTYSLAVVVNGNPSAPVTFTYSPLAAPAGLAVTPGNTQVSLTWNTVSGATAYNVLRSTTSGAYYAPVATITGTSYTDTGLTNGKTYYYVVTAVGSGGPSGYSAQASVAPVGPPPVPTGLTAVTAPSGTEINLSWNASFGATSYNVGRSSTSGGPYTTIGNSSSTAYLDTAAPTYYYVIAAVGPNGTSANSTQARPTATNTYTILNQNSGKAVNDPGNSTTAGTQMIQWTDTPGAANQYWTFTRNGDGSYTLQNGASGLVLDDSGGFTTNGTPVIQSVSTGASEQHWNMIWNSDGSYTVMNVSSGKVLEVPGGSTADGTKLDQWTDQGATWERWLLR